MALITLMIMTTAGTVLRGKELANVADVRTTIRTFVRGDRSNVVLYRSVFGGLLVVHGQFHDWRFHLGRRFGV